jgi:predicted Zn finger-like uncharacterized protein
MTPMVVQCSSCLTEFELDPNKVPPAGVRARCSVCSAVITVPARTVPARGQETTAAAAAATAVSPPPQEEHERPVPSPAPPTATSQAAEARDDPDERGMHAGAAAAAPAAETHSSSTLSGHSWTAPTAYEPNARPLPPSPPAMQAPAPAQSEAAAHERRPINPFLTRDPALRAKRLARALVSDIVAYHPARHAEGLRDGTLKTLFRDEIKKSYEEYVDQVGRDFAGSTTHFQDALNDVLASGKKLF